MSKILDYYRNYTDPIPPELLKAIRKGRCVLFAGAGMSHVCRSKNRKPLPDWVGLLWGLLNWGKEKARVDEDVYRDIVSLLEQQKFLIVAEELLERMGGDSVSSYINEVFDPQGIVPARRHELASVIPFRAMLTTNYENLLERAYHDIHQRNLTAYTVDQRTTVKRMLREGRRFVLKLHGDMESPSSLILGQRDYMRLLSDEPYAELLEELFRKHSLLMIGYGMRDPDITAAIDRIAITSKRGRPRHFLLSKYGDRNAVECRRLLKDQNIQVIGYKDYFGEHNHIETFLEALAWSLRAEGFDRVRSPLSRSIYVHYPPSLDEDGRFLHHYFFREGAITLSFGVIGEQDRILAERFPEAPEGQDLGEELQGRGYYVFLVTEQEPPPGSDFARLMARVQEKVRGTGRRVIYVVAGAEEKPALLEQIAPDAPVFHVPRQFSEKNLLQIRKYIEQDFRR